MQTRYAFKQKLFLEQNLTGLHSWNRFKPWLYNILERFSLTIWTLRTKTLWSWCKLPRPVSWNFSKEAESKSWHPQRKESCGTIGDIGINKYVSLHIHEWKVYSQWNLWSLLMVCIIELVVCSQSPKLCTLTNASHHLLCTPENSAPLTVSHNIFVYYSANLLPCSAVAAGALLVVLWLVWYKQLYWSVGDFTMHLWNLH